MLGSLTEKSVFLETYKSQPEAKNNRKLNQHWDAVKVH